MNTWLNYMIKANLCLCMVLGLYLLLLRRQTSFRIQRLVLLAGSMAAVVLPMIHAGPGRADLAVTSYLPTTWLPEVVITAAENAGSTPALQHLWGSPLFLLYAGGCGLLLVVFLMRLTRLLALLLKISPVTYERDGFRIIELPAPFTTFSFFGFVLLGGTENLSSRDKEMMLQHELWHSKSHHSLDIVWINLMQIFFWINPAIALYRKTFVQLHEFEADARAAQGHDVNEYCSLLAKVALESADFKLANHFSNSLIIKRINMIRIHKKRIAPWRMALLAAGMTGVFYLIVSSEQVMGQQRTDEFKALPLKLSQVNGSSQEFKAVPMEPGQLNDASQETVYEQVDEIAQYADGGLPGLASFIGKTLRYPEKARKDGVQGAVFVSFVVEKDGSVSDVTASKGVNSELDAESIRVVKLTRWIPAKNDGKVVRSKFTLPIKFKL